MKSRIILVALIVAAFSSWSQQTRPSSDTARTKSIKKPTKVSTSISKDSTSAKKK